MILGDKSKNTSSVVCQPRHFLGLLFMNSDTLSTSSYVIVEKSNFLVAS